jgi:transposase-like protein
VVELKRVAYIRAYNVISNEGADFTCPYCDLGYEIEEWHTEYGEPKNGDYEIKCEECSRTFVVGVFTTTTIETKKDRRGAGRE